MGVGVFYERGTPVPFSLSLVVELGGRIRLRAVLALVWAGFKEGTKVATLPFRIFANQPPSKKGTTWNQNQDLYLKAFPDSGLKCPACAEVVKN